MKMTEMERVCSKIKNRRGPYLYEINRELMKYRGCSCVYVNRMLLICADPNIKFPMKGTLPNTVLYVRNRNFTRQKII